MATVNVLVREWNARFRKDSLASGVVAGLRDRGDELWEGTLNLLHRESPEYRNSVDRELIERSKKHCDQILQTIIAIATGRITKGVDPFDFVRKHAQWRVRHQVPLARQQRAYRVAHRIYRETTQKALLRTAKPDDAIVSLSMLSDFWIEFFDYVSAVLAEAHAVEEGLIVAQNTRAYASLIDDLLCGLEPRDAEARGLRTLCGIRPGAPLAVVVARPFQPVNGKEIDLEVTLRSFVRLVQQVLPSAVFGKLVDIRNGEVTVILCGDRDTSRSFLKVLRKQGFGKRAANGLAVGVGASLDTQDVARLPESLEEARLAQSFTSPAQPLGHFADIDLPQLLIRRADSVARRLIPEGIRHLTPAGGEQSAELLRTVRAYADCSLNVKQTAQSLGVHTNTVYFRLNRINKLTGIDPRTFSGLSRLLTALQLLETHVSGK